jgi:HK97 family phage prohead protease
MTMNEIEYRSAAVAGVSFPERTISLVVMPYDTETMVEHQGRVIREVIARGAFDGIQRRSNKVHVNRDHDPARVVGRAVAFHPEADAGLVADCRIARTLLGDETLQLADEQILDASAGFAPMEQRWEPGPLRRVIKAFLAHIAMTPDPAYPGAKVLAVRTAPEAVTRPQERPETPNLDLIRSWRQQAAYDSLTSSNYLP